MKRTLLSIAVLALFTVNAFSQWSVINIGTTAEVNAVHMVSPTHILLGVDDGNLYQSTDGGSTWTTSVTGSISDFYFMGSKGIAVGESGLVLITTDNGVTWIPGTSGTTGDLEAVQFPNATTGYAVGRDGVMIKTTDGGLTWTPLTSGTVERLEDVWFVDVLNGFVAGREGVMLRTMDGGASWSSMNLGSGDNSAISFTDNSNGFIAGENGIFYTSDGGANWTPLPTSIPTELGDITFVNANVGYAVAEMGFIGKTTDGGFTWAEDTTITINELGAVSFADLNNGFAVGDFGTVVKFSTTGGTGIIGNNIVKPNIYPNPAAEELSIDLSMTHIEKGTVATIFDIAGRKVHESSLTMATSKVNISGLERGVYFVRINVKDVQSFEHKLVIE